MQQAMQPEERASEPIGGRYRLLRTLASGGGTSTHEVIDTENNRLCILKTLHLQTLSQWKRLDLFKREARTLAHLEHPQIPALLDYFEDRDESKLECHLVIEHVSGKTLASMVSQGMPLSEPACFGIAVQTLRVLGYLHSYNPPVIHRDLKPSNIMLDEQGLLHLIDFGGVQEAMAVGAGGSTMIGTYGYMAPEQFAGRALPQSDLYALGATLVYLLSGREPASLPQSEMLINFRPWVDCSERFAHWIEHLLLPMPEQRFRSAAEALEVLQEILPAYAHLALAGQSQDTGMRNKKRIQTQLLSVLEREQKDAPSVAQVPKGDFLTPGTLLDQKYVIDEVLGQGDIAITYAATLERDGTEVVIRELHFDKLTRWKSYELFEREFRALSRLEHPALPRLLDHFEHKAGERHKFYLVSKRIRGQTLDQRLRQGWRPEEKEVRAIGVQLLKILEFLQSLEPPLIHRDIKPSNILIDESDKVHLIDFGAVQEAFRLQGGGGSTVIGTYGYMAPEQCVGKAMPASDLYGVGATLIHLLTGRSPSELQHAELRIQFAQQVNCSRQMFQWLEKMVAPSLEQRYADPRHAREVLQQLDKLPVASNQLLQQAEEILGEHEPAIAIVEDLQGLQLTLQPMYHDHKMLWPLVLGTNLALVPMLIMMHLQLGLMMAVLLPLGGALLVRRTREMGQTYRTRIHIDPERLSYSVHHDDEQSADGSDVLERIEHPVTTISGLFLEHSPVRNRLGLRIQPDPHLPPLIIVAQYPLSSDRRKAEYLLERMRETLAFYRRQKGKK